MTPGTSVTHWINLLKKGEPGAAQRLWERYFDRLVWLARGKLEGARRRAADEEDVALSAFDSFCRGAADGRFPQLQDRDNLWPLLVVITARKALDQLAREHARRRGGCAAKGESRISSGDAGWGEAALEQVVGEEPTPEFAAQVAEEYRRLLDLLGDETLRQVAVWKMEGLTNDEVAERLDCSRRTVARKLETIRIIWSREPAP